MTDKAPAFQFYPKDFLSDAKVQQMSNTEVGIYVRLLCSCWLEGGLPLETTALAHLARMPVKQFTKIWENTVVRSCFYVVDGQMQHKRLDEEREKQAAFRRRQSDKGKASAAARSVQPEANHGSTAVQPSMVQPEGNSSSSSPICYLQTPVSQSARVIAEPDVSDRARELLEAYPEWYARWRHGARTLVMHNALTFQDACQLCQTWDDPRLEKLAKIVLTTDEPFIANTDRSFKIFALKASWADDRLRQVENAVAV
jgi:uncharacterized protein YdaU (DUF1376 family)